jgi:hypothetical protein
LDAIPGFLKSKNDKSMAYIEPLETEIKHTRPGYD